MVEAWKQGTFPLENTLIYLLHMLMLSKKHQRISPVYEEELTNEGRRNLLLLYKQVHKKMY